MLYTDYLNAKVEVSTGLEITSVSCRSGSNPDLGGEGHVPTALTSKKPPATRGATGGFCSISIYRIKRWSRFGPTKHDRFSIPGLRKRILIPPRY